MLKCGDRVTARGLTGTIVDIPVYCLEGYRFVKFDRVPNFSESYMGHSVPTSEITLLEIKPVQLTLDLIWKGVA
jgi:hypothetical protein